MTLGQVDCNDWRQGGTGSRCGIGLATLIRGWCRGPCGRRQCPRGTVKIAIVGVDDRETSEVRAQVVTSTDARTLQS